LADKNDTTEYKNQDDASYQLSHVWDKLLTDGRNWKSVLMKTSAEESKCR